MTSPHAFAGSVPANYDKYLGPLLFEPYALDMAGRLSNAKLQQVLELACGTGRVTKHLVSLLTEDGQLLATDINADMLAFAKTKVEDNRIKWQVADAQELPFERERFDHVICQFGLMFFPDKQQACNEAYRVLQPGGKFIFSVWDDMLYNPRSFPIKKIADDMFGADAPDLLKKGPYSFFDKDEIKRVIQKAGFRELKIEEVKKTASYDTVDDVMKGFVDGSPLSSFLHNKPLAVQKELKQRLRQEITAQVQQYGSEIPLQALLIEALK
ncbi:MAG TPA: class I SAM-dependent methyltransferase [Flavisolibacter sp.]|nr:class I SAM-dependent methyltransferase [Flavisolibacter sp.]